MAPGAKTPRLNKALFPNVNETGGFAETILAPAGMLYSTVAFSDVVPIFLYSIQTYLDYNIRPSAVMIYGKVFSSLRSINYITKSIFTPFAIFDLKTN